MTQIRVLQNNVIKGKCVTEGMSERFFTIVVLSVTIRHKFDLIRDVFSSVQRAMMIKK